MDTLPLPHSNQEEADFAAGQRSTWVSVAVNAVLTIAQLIVGLMANAQSLVADSLHSLSDLVSDGFVLVASQRARHPADRDHPYGHGRIETATSLFLGVALLAVGVGFLWVAGSRIETVGNLPLIDPLAFWVALFTLCAKELLFRYQLAVAKRVRSPMLMANAWHQRADAASSLVVAVGIGGSLLGYAFADLLAAAIVGFMIARMGYNFASEALQELIDTALPAEEIAGIRATLAETSGVLGVHDLRTRRMSRQVLVDAHVLVDSRISVSEGHRVAEVARMNVLKAHPEVLDVLVHIDPERDDDASVCRLPQPSRDDLIPEIRRLLSDFPPAERVVLHYLAGQVELDLYWPETLFNEPDLQSALLAKVQMIRTVHPLFSRIDIYQTCARI